MIGDSQKRKFEHLFTRMDANGDGQIDGADLELIVARVAEVRGPSADAGRLAALSEKYRFMHQGLVAMADTDKSGQVSLKEWVAYLDKVVGDQGLYEQVIGGLTQLFHEIIDRNGDDKNDIDDFRAFLTSIRADASAADATFAQIDTDGDGQLSLANLQSAMKDFFQSDALDGPGTYFFGKF
jgi:Ca2+-binding EF-hand superfamily protein